MKKLLCLVLMIFILAGCTQIKDYSISEVTDRIINKDIKQINQYRNGYKYYLPRHLEVESRKKYNEVLIKGDDYYYLYVDLLSKYYNEQIDFEENEKIYYSKKITGKNTEGYINITKEDDNYLVEIVYNYAKIEVIVDKVNINGAIIDSLIILSSIKYNDEIINNLVGSKQLNITEDIVDIFKGKDNNQNSYIKYVEQYDNYNKDETISDEDLVY